MPKFQVAVTWSMSGTYTVEAESLQEAEDKILDAEPPYAKLPKGEYIDESMMVDSDRTNELNKSEEDDDE